MLYVLRLISARTELATNILQSFDDKMQTIGVFLDLSKAFDTINHSTLLKQLQHYGVRGQALEWFRNYLTGRKQFVAYKNSNSITQEMECGVPQGSVLGPLLFIIYTNDLPNALRYCRCVLFADDTTLYYSSRDLATAVRNITTDLENLTEWFKSNKLSLNIAKTNFMLFSKKHPKPNDDAINLSLANETINKVNSTKFLGMMIDDKLNWEVHLNYTKNKMSSGLYALNKSKHVLDQNHLRILYFSLIHPYLNYGSVLWGSAQQKYVHRLEIMQNKAMRVIQNLKYNSSAKPTYKKLKVLPIEQLCQQQLGKLMFMHHNSTLPPQIKKIFTINNTVHHHNTRHSNDPHIPQHSTRMVVSSFIHKAPEIWYKIPQDIKESQPIKSFNKKLKDHLLNHS